MTKEMPKYHTPQGFVCPYCKKPCRIIGLRNDFDYAGTHCTHGQDGTCHPDNWGDPVTSCCMAPVDDYEYNEEKP